MARRNTAFLLILLASAALASACGPDRFTDSGCDSNDDCRGDRVCVEGLCVGESAASDAGDDDGGQGDVDDDEDAETLDIGNEEDADDDTDVDAFLGAWSLEGPVTVLTDDGSVLQEIESQPFPAVIRRGEQSDLFVEIDTLDGCAILATATTPETFDVQPLDCDSNPIDQLQGEASILGGTGRLRQDSQTLELELSIQLEASLAYGIVIFEIDADGARTDP